ncbi:hypothetical protein ACKXGD_16445, partial [Enterococcus lactis]|uniref:hypothetical protein n=1 Tax=Enterococcus lactis TaxID=357441 RepID=UPI0039080EDE
THTHTNATIHDQLSNIRCCKLSDCRWYTDMLIFRVMIREDSNQPFWKEKFINAIPNLLGHKRRTEFSNEYN